MMAKFPFFSLIAVTVFISCSDTKQEEESIQTYNKAVIDPVVAKKEVPYSVIINSIHLYECMQTCLINIKKALFPNYFLVYFFT